MNEQRNSQRRSIVGQARLRRSGNLSFVVNAYDVSERGCKLEFVERPASAETVWVKFDGLEALESVVRWAEGFQLGVEFRRPIDSRVLQQLLTRLS